jgi:casein kinase II subunit alpha
LDEGLLFKREPFFRGVDDEDQLVRIVHVLGTQGLHHYMHKYNIPLKKELR